MNFSSDLCTLPTLTESTLLSSVEQRYKDKLTESYVGGVLLSLGPSNKIKGPQFLPSFASSVLRSLAFSFEDQSILICGHNASDKSKLCCDLLSSLLTHLERSASLGASVLLALELLDYICASAEDECGRAVIVSTLVVNGANLTLQAARMSCLLLDTSSVSQFKVFHQQNGIEYVETCLTKLGMEPWLLRQVCSVFGIVRALLSGSSVTEVLREVHVKQLSCPAPSEQTLAELLYSYLVHWIVSWVNSYAFGTGSATENCSISMIYAPGHSFFDQQPASVPALVTRYANEILHNLYCTRLFVWEQEQYLEEGMEWDTVEVEFNQNLVNAFHQEGGLFEVCNMTGGDEMLAGMRKCCGLSGDSCFMLGSTGNSFTLEHFTGECDYIIDRKWIETNVVHMASPDLQTSLLCSSCDVLVDIVQRMKYSPDVLPGGVKIENCRLTQRAAKAMDSVCDLITTSHPHFVFCFMPFKDENGTFSREFVLSQLQQFKLLDIALIQSCGFPVRLKHSNFIKNYGAMCINSFQVLTDKEKCEHILSSANLKEWHVGNTMVLLKPWHLGQLDTALDLFNQSAKKLQRVFRQSILRKSNPLLTTQAHSIDCVPPAPPPRPDHTLESAHAQSHNSSSVHVDYDKASSPPNSPRISRRKQSSWRKSSSSNSVIRSSSTTADLHSYMWFQGKLSREKAEGRLKEVQFDCFLIRESESRVGEFALSLRHDGIIKHFRIDTKRGANPRYELYGAKRSFSSLEALVDYYSHHCISSGGELLTTPFSTKKQDKTAPLKRKLSSIRRPKPSLVAVPVNDGKLPRTKTTPALNSGSQSVTSVAVGLSSDLSDDTIAMRRRELEVEERIVEAARRMAELPTSSRRERQKRKQSLQQAQSRLLSLRQQFHTLQERKRFIETSMLNI